MPRRLHLRKKARIGNPTMKRSRSEGEFSTVLEVRGLSHHLLGAVGTLFTASLIQIVGVQKGGQLMTPCPAVSSPSSPAMGLRSLLRAPGWVSRPIWEFGGKKTGIPFFFLFSLSSSVLLHVSVQPSDSIMTYTNSISLVMGPLSKCWPHVWL